MNKKLVQCASVPAWVTEDVARKVDELVKSLPKDDAYRFRQKDYLAENDEIENGESVAWVTTKDVDRTGDVINPKGIDLADYLLNPIVLFNHDEDRIVGKCLWAKVTDYGIKTKTRYASTPLGQEIYQLEKEGILKGKSVTILPLEVREPTREEADTPEYKGCKFVIDSSLLLEYSCVSLPCNAHALTTITKSLPLDLLEIKKVGRVTKPKPTMADVMVKALKRLEADLPRMIDDKVARLLGRV